MVFAANAGIAFWFPKMCGRMMDERLGKLQFWMTFIGFHGTFLIQHWLGNEGMPRRYVDYLATDGFTTLNTISTIFSFVLGASIIPFLYNVVQSWKYGQLALRDDPWGHGNSLEWATSSPPPRHNFVEIPKIRSERPAFEAHYPHLLERLQAEAHAGKGHTPVRGRRGRRREHRTAAGPAGPRRDLSGRAELGAGSRAGQGSRLVLVEVVELGDLPRRPRRRRRAPRGRRRPPARRCSPCGPACPSAGGWPWRGPAGASPPTCGRRAGGRRPARRRRRPPRPPRRPPRASTPLARSSALQCPPGQAAAGLAGADPGAGEGGVVDQARPR